MPNIILCTETISESLDSDAVCRVSKTAADLIASNICDEEAPTITLSGCTPRALSWIKAHIEGGNVQKEWPTDDVTEDFVSFLNTCDYMNISTLFDLAVSHARHLLFKQTPDRLRTALGVEMDFSPDEFTKISRENKWIDDPTQDKQATSSASSDTATNVS